MKKVMSNSELTSFNPVITFIVIGLLSFIISLFIYAMLNGILISDIIDQWKNIVDNWFSVEGSFFLIFLIVILILGISVYAYNKYTTNLYNQSKCTGVWNKKKKICE